jgi:endonuclease YncB( thermonuclease family)
MGRDAFYHRAGGRYVSDEDMTFVLYQYQAQVVRVVDGDTCEISIDLGLKIYRRQNCRLSGINTPELNATNPAVREKATAAKQRLIELVEGKNVFIISKKLDNYGRPLVEIFLSDGTSVNQTMIDEGYAVVMKGLAIS